VKRALAIALPVGLCVAGIAGCDDDTPAVEPGEELSGGDATVFDTSDRAFGLPPSTLDRDGERAFLRGRALFRDDWVEAPASTDSRDGLGPLFNARSCEACHVRDGRGRPPIGDELLTTMLLRLSGPDGADEPTYGDQLQPLAIPDVPAEGNARVVYDENGGQLADGQAYTLRHPTYEFVALGYGPMAEGVQVSPRVAPMMIGLGLLEAVPAATLEALADPDDADGDGISGRVNRVAVSGSTESAVGRFGIKANQPTVRQQTAGAFLGDIGLTSSLFENETCTPAQVECANSVSGGDPELFAAILDDVTFYSRALAVPARRDVEEPDVLLGRNLFGTIGCAACHVPVLETGAFPDVPELANQTIRPYTDLLLHDMGPELADGRPDFAATGQEWRTPPLWGIGLVETVNGHLLLMHDGRARGFEEAILWHGGEGAASRDGYTQLDASDRQALVRFLESL